MSPTPKQDRFMAKPYGLDQPELCSAPSALALSLKADTALFGLKLHSFAQAAANNILPSVERSAPLEKIEH